MTRLLVVVLLLASLAAMALVLFVGANPLAAMAKDSKDSGSSSSNGDIMFLSLQRLNWIRIRQMIIIRQ